MSRRSERLLVTTAIEETWSDTKPLLFLGEWCRLFQRRARWSALDAAVVPYHWNDRRKLEKDYQYLFDLYLQLLPELAAKLNEIHGTDRSCRYWRILVGPWLGYFVQMYFDRWESIRRATAENLVSGSVVLTVEDSALVPRTMSEFIPLFLGDPWNHHICASILPSFGVRLEQKPVGSAYRPPVRAIGNVRSRLKHRIADRCSRFVGRLVRDDAVVMYETYLPWRQQLQLSRRLNQMPQYWRAGPPPRVPASSAARAWCLGGEGNSPFEAALRAVIPTQIPSVYLEGYSKLVGQTNELPWPKAPRVIWTSSAHIADDGFKAWAAAKVETNSALVIGQHGGHFGIGRWNFHEDHEMTICDRYLSWGWSEPAQRRVVPIGQLKVKRSLPVHHASQPDALLVTGEVPRYSYWMYSIMVAGQYLDYLEDQYAFLDALPPQIRERIVIRLYPTDSGRPYWDQSSRMRQRLSGVRFDDGRVPMEELVRRSRLYIATYNATTFLESITMNVPTVIFWDPKYAELRDSAVPYFEELRSVGVFHITPASAARHVKTIWDDVGSWWNSALVREAVRRFRVRYADASDHLVHRLAAVLREVGRDSRAAQQ